MGRKRKPGEGAVLLRKDGRWEGRVVIGYDEKNLPKTKNVLARTKAECIEKLDRLKEECAELNRKLPSRAEPSMPFGEWIDLWYQTWCKPGIRPTTQKSYETRIYQHIVPELGDIPLDQLSQSDLQQFYAKLKKDGRLIRRDMYGSGLSDPMIRSCHTACYATLEKAKMEGLIPVNPAVGCKLPPKKSREMQVLTHDEMRRFLIQAREEGCYEMALLELATGLRRGEICALMWEDLDMETGELRVERTVNRLNGELQLSEPKTKASVRTVILPQSVVNVLREYRKTTDSRWMFPSPVKEDSPRDPSSVRKKLRRVEEHAGCKITRFHDLRHTFCSTSLEHGMDIKTLSAVIGHVSSATTIDVYSHVTDQMRVQAAEKIETGFGRNETWDAAEKPTEQPVTSSEAKREPFRPYRGQYRKPGTGGVYRLGESLYEGRYTPKNADGKREVHTVYAGTPEECETALAAMIAEVKARIAENKQKRKEQTPTS